MIDYKGIIFFNSYDLDNHFEQMYEQLINEFNCKVICKNYFENESFVLLIGSGDEIIIYREGYFFLDIKIAFPPNAQTYDCTICWKIDEKNKNKYEFYWTDHFPEKELQEYINKHPCK